MNTSNHEYKSLIEVFKASNGLTLKTLQKRANISQIESEEIAKSMTSKLYCTMLKNRLLITKTGVTHLKDSFFDESKNDTFIQKNIKEEFLGKQININEFYIPQNFEK